MGDQPELMFAENDTLLWREKRRIKQTPALVDDRPTTVSLEQALVIFALFAMMQEMH